MKVSITGKALNLSHTSMRGGYYNDLISNNLHKVSFGRCAEGDFFSSSLDNHQNISDMKNDFIQNGRALYAAPDCHPFAFAPEGVLCGSERDNYGTVNYPGNDLLDDDYGTNF